MMLRRQSTLPIGCSSNGKSSNLVSFAFTLQTPAEAIQATFAITLFRMYSKECRANSTSNTSAVARKPASSIPGGLHVSDYVWRHEQKPMVEDICHSRYNDREWLTVRIKNWGSCIPDVRTLHVALLD
jgi:hypothetical protein